MKLVLTDRIIQVNAILWRAILRKSVFAIAEQHIECSTYNVIILLLSGLFRLAMASESGPSPNPDNTFTLMFADQPTVRSAFNIFRPASSPGLFKLEYVIQQLHQLVLQLQQNVLVFRSKNFYRRVSCQKHFYLLSIKESVGYV